MSDFLARLAARAIGGEETLAPRLPSLFEPSTHATILPTIDDHAVATPRRATATADDASSATASLHPPHAMAPLSVDAPHTAPVAQSESRLPAPVGVPAPDRTTSTPVRAAPPAPPTIAPIASLARVPPPEPARAEPAAAAPIQPRQTRIAPPRIEAAPPPSGSLLPSSPVFTTPRIAPAREQAERAATIRPRAAQPANRATAPSEPVVHVTIGRLEVRAAPAAATPARRRDEPRPASLDDYLRQRGGKAAP